MHEYFGSQVGSWNKSGGYEVGRWNECMFFSFIPLRTRIKHYAFLSFHTSMNIYTIPQGSLPPPRPPLTLHLWQSQKLRHQFWKIRRPQSRNGIPPRHSREPRCPTALISSLCNIIQQARICIKRRVDESNTTLSNRQPCLVDKRDDGPSDGRGCRSAVHKRKCPVNRNDVVCSVGCNVREPARLLGVVELGSGVRGWVVCEPGFDSSGLVRREGEDVREAAAGEDNCFASFFWCGDGGAGNDLRRADGGDVGAGGWEARVEHARGAVIVGAVWGDTLASVASDAIVTRGVENGGALKAEFHVFVALADFVGGSEVGLVVAVRGGDYFCGGEATTILRTGVAAWERVGIGGILGGVIAAFVGTVRAVDGVEEGVEGSAFDQVADLVEGYWLRIN